MAHGIQNTMVPLFVTAYKILLICATRLLMAGFTKLFIMSSHEAINVLNAVVSILVAYTNVHSKSTMVVRARVHNHLISSLCFDPGLLEARDSWSPCKKDTQ